MRNRKLAATPRVRDPIWRLVAVLVVGIMIGAASTAISGPAKERASAAAVGSDCSNPYTLKVKYPRFNSATNTLGRATLKSVGFETDVADPRTVPIKNLGGSYRPRGGRTNDWEGSKYPTQYVLSLSVAKKSGLRWCGKFKYRPKPVRVKSHVQKGNGSSISVILEKTDRPVFSISAARK